MKVIRYTKKGKKRLDVKFSKKEEIIMSVIAFTLSILFIITGQITIEALSEASYIMGILFFGIVFLGVEWVYISFVILALARKGKVEVEQ